MSRQTAGPVTKDLEEVRAAKKAAGDGVDAEEKAEEKAAASELRWHQLLNPKRAIDHHKSIWASMGTRERARLVALYVGVVSLIAWIVGVIIMLVDTSSAKSDANDMSSDRYEQLLKARGENPTQTRIMTAIIGYYLGPLLLFYGYQIPQLIIVLTALISSGLGKYAESIEHMEQLNMQAAGGSIMPKQVSDFAKLLLSTFTIASAEMKIPAFDSLMKGAVCANILLDSIVNMIPTGDGCMCGELADIECSPVFNAGMYMVELRCYDDRWRRFLVRWVFTGFFGLLAMYYHELTFRLNPAVLGANLMCQAIFDTVLAVLPEYGSRVQPYRFVGLLLFTSVSTRLHFWMQQFARQVKGEVTEEVFDREVSAIPLLRPTLALLHRVGLFLMFPLRVLDEICDSLRTLGQQDLIIEELEKRAFVEAMAKEPAVAGEDVQTIENMRELSTELVKLSAKVEVIDSTDTWMHHLGRIVSALLLLSGLWLFVATMHLRSYTEWGVILPERVVNVAVTSSVALMVMAILGLAGVHTRSTSSLCGYMVMVGITCFATTLGAVYAYDTASSVHALGLDLRNAPAGNSTVAFVDARVSDVTDLVRSDFLATYGNAECRVPHNATLAGKPWLEGAMQATRCSAGARQLQAVVRNRCAYYNRTEADALAAGELEAYQDDDWERYLRLGIQRRGVLRQAHSISTCFSKYQVSHFGSELNTSYVTPPSEHGALTYCLCRSALAEDIYEYSRIIAAVAFAAVAVQLLLFFCSVTMLRRQRAKVAMLEQTMKVRRQLADCGASEAAKAAVLQTMESISGTEVCTGSGEPNSGRVSGGVEERALRAAEQVGKGRQPKRQIV